MIFDFFKKEQDDIQFLDSTKAAYNHYPPILAKELKPLKTYQEAKYEKYNFPQCPGMYDYARHGYIIPAWSNFHIKANKAGVVAFTGSKGEDQQKRRHTPFMQPKPMDPTIIDGAFKVYDDIPLAVFNFGGPWKVHGKGNISGLLLPAIYHNNFFEDLYMYPGIVDYNGFTTINFICSPRRKCEITINAGDPLIHFIPFITSKNIKASYGPITDTKNDYDQCIKWFNELNFYRKYYMIRKKFSIRKNYKE